MSDKQMVMYKVFAEAAGETNRNLSIPDMHMVVAANEPEVEREFEKIGVKIYRIHNGGKCRVLDGAVPAPDPDQVADLKPIATSRKKSLPAKQRRAF